VPVSRRRFDAEHEARLAAEKRAEEAEAEVREVSGANGRLAAQLDQAKTAITRLYAKTQGLGKEALS
jgi:hypothetical protein